MLAEESAQIAGAGECDLARNLSELHRRVQVEGDIGGGAPQRIAIWIIVRSGTRIAIGT